MNRIQFTNFPMSVLYIIMISMMIPLKLTYAQAGHECPICLGAIENDNKINLNCGHQFDQTCIKNWSKVNPTCPMCRSEIGLVKQYQIDSEKIYKKLSLPSLKLVAGVATYGAIKTFMPELVEHDPIVQSLIYYVSGTIVDVGLRQLPFYKGRVSDKGTPIEILTDMVTYGIIPQLF